MSHHPIHEILRTTAEQNGGALLFRDFMDLCLHHPQHGYYNAQKARIGRSGDFVTAPELTSLFGELITLQLVEIWGRMGAPSRFDVVEMGAGVGRMAADILRTARLFTGFKEAIRYAIVDSSPDFRQRQHETLAQAGIETDSVRWGASLLELTVEAPIDGVILGNEFLDALPVHGAAVTDQGLREIVVTWDAHKGAWREQLEHPSAALAGYCEQHNITAETLQPGWRFEAHVAADGWMRQAANTLGQGALLFIDYGEAAREMRCAGRAGGTLMGHYRHKRVDDPLKYPGEMDITAHVDFSAMARAAEAGGAVRTGFTTQSWFLMGLGILERLEQMQRMVPDAAQLGAIKQAASRLLMPGAMGDFKALLLTKGIAPSNEPLAGFRLNNRLNAL
ncbi:class I SAM-dependent methyltransferase [Magnetofaba australis]|uniref:SAM-dependent methyltransferase n=1 Tax=Magnetofaba australis IT-1 TaxID=1434232 RepID=A0A1Y2K9U3_9PROT|nr:SAM-dependent methyltransferase [Magnetofaba australis]OSM06230.1 hypothetical protein MAIT1_01213 [Magnetofaba australis IT-1]